MRLLVLTADLPPQVHSGVGRSVGYQVQGLSRFGCETDVLTTAPGACVPGVRITPLNTDRFPEKLRGRDVVHLHSLRLAELALQLKERDGSRLLYTAHSLLERELEDIPQATQWKELQARILHDSDHLIFLNEGERIYACERWPGLRGRSTVLRHGIPMHQPDKRQFAGPPVVLFAGRFCRSKGIDVAVATMRCLLQSDPSAHCVLAGGRGDAASERLAQELAKEYPQRCRVPGWLSQNVLDNWLQRTTVLLAPSRYEPFGMIALEALAKGVPVLGARVDGLVDLLRPGSGGTTVEGHAVEAWTKALVGLLTDRAGLAAMSTRGPRYVRTHYGLEAHAKQYTHLLRSCARHGETVTVASSSEAFWQAEDLTPCG